MNKNTIVKYVNIASIIIGAVFFLSCENKSIREWSELNDTTKPDVVGHNIEIIYSSDAHIKFRIEAPKVVEQYKDDKPYVYTCPQGVKLWQYDKNMQVNFTMVADSAYIIESVQYYELWGNVVLERKQDSTLVKTEKLIIDKQNNVVFSDTTLVINKYGQLKDAVAEGFTSDLEFEKPQFTELTQGEVNYDRMRIKSTRNVDTLSEVGEKTRKEATTYQLK